MPEEYDGQDGCPVYYFMEFSIFYLYYFPLVRQDMKQKCIINSIASIYLASISHPAAKTLAKHVGIENRCDYSGRKTINNFFKRNSQ